MIENNLLPDFVLNLEDGHTQPDYLLKRVIELHGFQSENSNTKGDNDKVQYMYIYMFYCISHVYDFEIS